MNVAPVVTAASLLRRPIVKLVLVASVAAALAAGLGGGVSTGKVKAALDAIIARCGTETEFWNLSARDMRREFSTVVPEKALRTLAAVRDGRFRFNPPGHDGA